MGCTKLLIRSTSLLLFVAATAHAANICDPTIGTDCLKVDNGSGAGHVALYDGDDIPLHPDYQAVFSVQITVRQSTAAAANVRSWAIHNPSGTRTTVITHCTFQLFFDGTAAATVMKYEFEKVTGVTSFTGGTVVSPIIRRTTAAPTAVARVLDTGLTLTGAATQGSMWVGVQGRVTQTTTAFNSSIATIDFVGGGTIGVELAQNEALAIRNSVTAVIGDNINGVCHGYERNSP